LNRCEAASQVHGELESDDVDNGRIELREKGTEHNNRRDLPDQRIKSVAFAGNVRRGDAGEDDSVDAAGLEQLL
jgi:hypothetical protein